MKYDRFNFENKLMGVLRGYDFEETLFAITSAYKAGMDVFEVALRYGKETQDLITISALKKTLPDNIILGAGTVLGVDLLDKAVHAGADFIVSPVTEPAVITKCLGYGIPCIPGACTPTEIYNAYKFGATLVKLFPANELGPKYLKSVKQPMPQIPIIAMGGITPQNIAQFSNAGAAAFGISSGIFRKEEIKARNESAIINRIKAYSF